MKENKEVKISYGAAHLTTIVSVTLVLIIIGVIALASVAARRETERLKEKIELTVIMADSVSNASAASLADEIGGMPFTSGVKLVSKEEALRNWAEETGENLQTTFGVNPLSPEISFSVKADYANRNSLSQIRESLSRLPGVESVDAPDASLVESMNRNVEKLSIVLGCIALVLVVISFALINNTVHLSIYSRRFSIHTMQLVGATNSFIRKPFLVNNVVSGIVSGLLASALLAIPLLYASNSGFQEVKGIISWETFACVAGALVLVGALMCGLASMLATTRYLRKDYDELFK